MTQTLDRTPTVEMLKIGPTWQLNPSWDGVSEHPVDKYLLPERTLAWQIFDWARTRIHGDDGKPFRPTHEQIRFVAWWYAVDGRGRFLYRNGVLQRLKGW